MHTNKLVLTALIFLTLTQMQLVFPQITEVTVVNKQRGIRDIQSFYGNLSCPIQPGNIWVWRDWYGDLEKFWILSDTVRLNSKYFFKSSNQYAVTPQLFRFDTSGYYELYDVSFMDTTKVIKYYKNKAKREDLWQQQRLYPPGRQQDTLFHVVIDTTSAELFNLTIHNVKVIHFYGVPQLMDNDIEYWSDEFGLIHAERYEGGPYDLVAARINGRDYGATSLLVDAAEATQPPRGFTLSQNYPNPFNPSTRIRYVLPTSGSVALNVYSVLGKQIQTLINEEQDAGTYDVSFNASSLPAGIYFYELRHNTFRQVKKMVLLK